MSKLYLAIATDDNYAKYAAIAIQSVIDTLANDWCLDITVFDGGIHDDSRNLLMNISNKSGADIRFYDSTADTSFDGLPAMGHWTKAMYYRLSVGEAIPRDASRVIYIDCDVLVMTSLHRLFETDLGDAWLGAVENPDDSRLVPLNITKSKKYFNSGVLLIDLKAWRENELKRRALDICIKLQGNLVSPDQDILNVLYDGYVKFIDWGWNAQSSMFQRKKYWAMLRKRANIYHFTTNAKPWNADDPHPMADEYRCFAKKIGLHVGVNPLNIKSRLIKFKRWVFRFSIFELSLFLLNITRKVFIKRCFYRH